VVLYAFVLLMLPYIVSYARNFVPEEREGTPGPNTTYHITFIFMNNNFVWVKGEENEEEKLVAVM